MKCDTDTVFGNTTKTTASDSSRAWKVGDGSSESGRKPHVIPHHISAKSTQDCDNEGARFDSSTDTPSPHFELEDNSFIK